MPNYPTDSRGRVTVTGRPIPARPARADDHHDHRHFPFVEDDCRICEQLDAPAVASPRSTP